MKRLMCESCGADLPEPGAKGYSRCPACGQTSQVEEPSPPPAPAAPRPIVINVDRSAASPVTKAAAKTGGATVLIGILVAVTVSIVVAAVAISVSSGDGPLRSKGPKNIITLGGFVPVGDPGAAPKLGTDGATDAMAVVQEYTDSAHRYLTRFTVGSDAITERWRSPELPEDVYNVTAARIDQTVFVGVADHVWALEEATGKRRWVADLDDEVSSGCPECFVTVGGRLVVRTKDSQLASFAPESSEPQWKLRLESPAATVSVRGGRLFVLDDKVDGDKAAVRTIDPATGATTATFTPACANPDFPSAQGEVRVPSPIIAVEGSTDLATIFTSFGGCVVRWDPASGAVRYATKIPELFAFDDKAVLSVGNDLVFPDESNLLVRIDLSSGQMAPLDPIADVDAVPDRIIGDTLIALTTTKRGSTRGGVAAWNLRTGKVLWQLQSPDKAKAASDSSDALFEGTAVSVLLSSNDGLKLLVFDDTNVTTYGIDLVSGALKTGKPKALPGLGGGTPSMEVEAIEPRRVVVTIERLLTSVPAGSGDIVTYPAAD